MRNDRIYLSSRQTGAILATAIALLTAANLVVKYLQVEHGRDWLLGFAPLLRVGSETSIPTFYSTSVLLACALLLLLIGRVETRNHLRFGAYWLLLGIFYLFLAADEGAAIHERLYGLTQVFLPESAENSLFERLPIAALVLVICLAFAPFFKSLSSLYRRLFITSIAVLFLGGIGMEMVGEDLIRPRFGLTSWFYIAATSLEELMEMCGAALLCYSLVLYIERELPDLAIRFGTPPAAERRLPRS